MLKWVAQMSGVFLIVGTFGLAPVKADDLDALFKEAVSFYNSGQIEKALETFRRMQEIDKGYRYFYNIGQCAFKLERYGLSIEAFNTFLSGLKEEELRKQREHAKEVVETITPLVGELEITGTTSVEVWVDELYRVTTPLKAPLLIAEGEHRVTLKRDDVAVLEKTIKVTGGAKTTIIVPQKENTSPKVKEESVTPMRKDTPASKVTKVPAIEKDNQRLSPVFWAGLAGTVVFAGISGVMWGVTVSKMKEHEDTVNEIDSKMGTWDFSRPEDDQEEKTLRERTNELASETETFNRVAVAMTVVTGACATLAVVGLVIKNVSAEPSQNRVTVGPGGVEVSF